jgi:hypothetical protein
VRDFDIIDLDMPSAVVVEISISCDLSIFPSQVDPHRAEGGRDAPEGSLSTSIGELWSDIDKLDEINCGTTFMMDLPGGAHRERHSSPSVARVNTRVSPTNKRALMDDAPRPSSALPRGRGRGRGSVRKKVAQILVVATRAISPHMRRSFVDR